jgi:signal transduction histidine kinase
MSRIRWKVLASMIAVVSVTIGLSALVTRSFTLEAFDRLLTARTPPDLHPLEAHYRTIGSWNGVEQTLDKMPARVVLTTAQRNVIAVSKELRDSSITVSTDDSLTISGRGMQVVIRLPPVRVDSAYAFVLPQEEPIDGVAALGRRLIITFVAATVAAVLIAFFVSGRITEPIERLTATVDAMACGANPRHVPVSGRDEIARLARSFNSMSNAIARHQELRRRMVSDVAHELRAPLTNLRGDLETIQDGLASPDPARIASIHEEVLHLEHIVGDLQDLAIADAGGLQLRRERVELGATVARVVDAFSASRRIHLSVEKVYVLADPVRIGQIVRNLLSNACRHANAAVHIQVARSEPEAVVSVADDGPGIPAEELTRIFDRFYRVDDARSRAAGGAGLGLAIVKQMVELHGGRVWAENGPEGGAVFTFALPSAP